MKSKTQDMSDLTKKTVKDLTEMCSSLGQKPPSSLRKEELIQFYHGIVKMQREGIKPTQKYNGNDLDYVPVYMELKEDQTWIQHLYENGWATVPVLENPKETEDDFFKWLESCSDKFKRDDPSTWNNIPSNLHGIFKHYIGHTEFVWKVREQCYTMFTQLWGSEDLITSFDGGCFLVGKGEQNKRKQQWIHNDHPRKFIGQGWTDTQCLVNIKPNGSDDGGLLLMEGSHRFFDEYMERHPIDGFGFCPADMTDVQLKECRPIKICAKEGEAILWDGRIFHCNVPPKNENNVRMCIYVSMMPKSGADKSELKRRIGYFEKGQMTGHWCYGPYLTSNGNRPRDYGVEHPSPKELEIAELNQVRRKLIGYE